MNVTDKFMSFLSEKNFSQTEMTYYKSFGDYKKVFSNGQMGIILQTDRSIPQLEIFKWPKEKEGFSLNLIKKYILEDYTVDFANIGNQIPSPSSFIATGDFFIDNFDVILQLFDDAHYHETKKALKNIEKIGYEQMIDFLSS